MAKWGWILKLRSIASTVADWAIWGRAKGWWQSGGPGSIPGPKQ